MEPVKLEPSLKSVAESSQFSGVAVGFVSGEPVVEVCSGFADRANERAVTADTLFGIASATKGFTALTIASLIESGDLSFDTRWRDLFPKALPLVDDAVTIEHLLGHRSGVGDYVDEEIIESADDYLMELPVHLLTEPLAYLPALELLPQVTPPGERFVYNNSGYVMLSAAAERAGGESFYTLVQERVLGPAGMTRTSFCRSDELPANAAIGYLEDGRSNVLHLPVRGAGDGGAYSCAGDFAALWSALFTGDIVPPGMVEKLVTLRSTTGESAYGLGFWLDDGGRIVMLVGMDAGVSMRSAFDRTSGSSYVVLANTSSGAWPMARRLHEWMGTKP